MTYDAYPTVATTPSRLVRKALRFKVFMKNKTSRRKQKAVERRARKEQNA